MSTFFSILEAVVTYYIVYLTATHIVRQREDMTFERNNLLCDLTCCRREV